MLSHFHNDGKKVAVPEGRVSEGPCLQSRGADDDDYFLDSDAYHVEVTSKHHLYRYPFEQLVILQEKQNWCYW